MKNPVHLSVLLLLLTGHLFSQVMVVDIADFKNDASFPALPDVDGKVLVHESYGRLMPSKSPDLSNIELYPNWPLSYTGSSNRGGIYCNLDSDDDLEIVYSVTQQVYAWNLDGSVVDGWPQSVLQYPDGAPAFGDIDGDGEGEIVVSSRQAGTGNTGTLSAFHKDGSMVDGFPLTLTGGATKTPVLADLNGDGALEIIIEERAWPDGYIGVYGGDGSSWPGFPVQLDYIPASSVAVGDITGDNVPEIIAESYYSIYALDTEGNVLDGFPFTPGNNRVFSYSSPVLADLDGDGMREIIAGDHNSTSGNGAVHILKHDGSAFPGWPKYTSYWIYGPPAVGDIDGDGSLDIAIGDQVLSGSPANRVYAWDKDGNALPGWPTSFINAINNQILLADLDGDNMVELMWDDNTSANIYLGYNHDGTPMDGWPLSLNGSSFFMNPFAADVNNDGDLDLSGASGDLLTNDLNFYLWDVNVAIDPDHSPLTILQYNVRHDGVYMDASALAAGFNASAVKVCEGTQVQFNDLTTGNPVSWEWTFEGGDPASSSAQNPLVTYAAAGEYDVSLTVSDGNTSSTASIQDYMQVSYDAVVPDQPSGPSNFSTDTANITYYSTWAVNADEYIWELTPDDVGVIVAGDTITEIKIYWSNDPDYSAELRVKAVNVCGESEFSDPLTIYVNWSVGTGDRNIARPFNIHPNPSDGELQITVTEGSTALSGMIYNAWGEVTRVMERLSAGGHIHVGGLPSGMYYLVLTDGQTQYIEKVVVR